MAKLNIFIFVGILLLLLGNYSIFFKKKENNTLMLKKKENEPLPTKEDLKSELFVEEIADLKASNPIIPEENKSSAPHNAQIEAEVKEKRPFKTADEIIDTLFPQIKSELGTEMIDHLKRHFPSIYILRILNVDQRLEYRKIIFRKIKDKQILNEPGGLTYLTPEEIRQKKAEIALTNEIYLPLLINVMTQEQQEQMAQKMLSEYFDSFRELKAQGLPFIEDESKYIERLKNDPKLQKIMEERDQALMLNPLLKDEKEFSKKK